MTDLFGLGDNPFIDMLKQYTNDLEQNKINKETYIAIMRDIIKHMEIWLNQLTNFAISAKLSQPINIQLDPANTSFDTKNRQKRRKAVEKLNKPS